MRSNPLSGLMAYLLIVAAIGSGFFFLGTALTGLLLLAWLGIGISYVLRIGVGVRYPLASWMLAYLLWMACTVWWSTIPNTSWLSAWVLAGLPITYLAWGMIPNPDKIWNMLRATLLLAGPAFALWGLGQVITGYGLGQPVGPLVDKNAFAALMNLFWFMASVHFILKASNSTSYWRIALSGFGLLLIALTLFAAESRGATLTWLLLMPFILWIGYRDTRNKRAIIMVLAIALTGYLGVANLLGLNVGHRSLSIEQLEQDASTRARLQMWKSTVQMVLDHPMTGTGLGTFAAHYPRYRDPLENTTSGRYAHNDYLQLAAEGGIPVLMLLLGIFVALLLQLRRVMTSSLDSKTLEATGLLLGALALFIHANLNFIFYFSFMNVLAGLFTARAIQLMNPAGVGQMKLAGLAQIGRFTKGVIAGFMVLLLAGPLLIQLMAQSTLTGSQPGLVLLRAVWPTLNAYSVASLITALRPSSGIAQEFLLSASEEALNNSDGIKMDGVSLQAELLRETLEHYELRRSQTDNNPAYGVREARILIQYRDLLDPGSALRQAREILIRNLQIDPFHVDSMIVLSRLDVVEGRPQHAQQLLSSSMKHVLSRRDQQLLAVEILRQRASARKVVELDVIENKLRNVRSDSETGKALILPENFSQNIDERLSNIARALN